MSSTPQPPKHLLTSNSTVVRAWIGSVQVCIHHDHVTGHSINYHMVTVFPSLLPRTFYGSHIRPWLCQTSYVLCKCPARGSNIPHRRMQEVLALLALSGICRWCEELFLIYFVHALT